MNHPRILRTDTGYQIDNLHASGFSPRQSQVLLMRAKGMQMKECATELNCSVGNIRNLLAALFLKLRASSSTDLISKAFQTGHLRILSALFFVALCLSTNATTENSHAMARHGRVRTSQNLRIQRNRRESEAC